MVQTGSGQIVRALILAGGLGTRLRPLTDTVPKCLVPIGGRPLLDYWVDCLAGAGIREARINTHALAGLVRDYLDELGRTGRLDLTESHEPVLLGSAGTVTANADLADGADQIVIVYADGLSDLDLRPLLAFHERHGDPLTMMLYRSPNPKACGIAELDAEGRIVEFVEKPAHPKSDLANGGIYVLTADAYREIAAMGAFDLGFDVLPRFVGRMRGWCWGGYHLDIGTHQALERAQGDVHELFPAGGPLQHTGNGKTPAVFLDRDGTLIEHVHYLADPELVRLIPGVAEALVRLRRMGYRRVVVTNQSAIARGILTEERLAEIHAEMERQLAAAGASVDAIYFCPDGPTSDSRMVIENPYRKPGPGMLLQGARELGLDLGASWMVGDMVSDALAGFNAGCRSILVQSGQGSGEDVRALEDRCPVLADLGAAADWILKDRVEERS
jgi:histidinol-phosphate phosphatase family protein